MTPRPPRRGFSVSRRLAGRARAAPEDTASPGEPPVDREGDAAIAGAGAGAGGIVGMVEAVRDLIERLAATAREQTRDAPSEAEPMPDGGVGHAVTLGGGAARMVFGYSLRMGRDGLSAEPFGDVPERAAAKRQDTTGPDTSGPDTSGPDTTSYGAKTPAARQPIVDVFEDGDTVVVVAELPGAEADGIICRAGDRSLLIEARGARRYRKELALPVAVRPDILGRSFRNGILEVRLARAATPRTTTP